MGEWRYGSTIPHLAARWKCVVSFTLRPLCAWGGSPRFPLDRRLGGPESRSGRYGEKKNLSPAGNRITAVQPVAHRYTDCAIPIPINCRNLLNYSIQHCLSGEADGRSASQKIPAFYETRRFIASFSRTSQWPIFWARWIQSTSWQPTFSITRIHFNITPNHI
jgi:hypothetical protein